MTGSSVVVTPLRLLCCNKLSFHYFSSKCPAVLQSGHKTEDLRAEFEKCQNKSLQATEGSARTLAQTESSNQLMSVADPYAPNNGDNHRSQSFGLLLQYLVSMLMSVRFRRLTKPSH